MSSSNPRDHLVKPDDFKDLSIESKIELLIEFSCNMQEVITSMQEIITVLVAAVKVAQFKGGK